MTQSGRAGKPGKTEYSAALLRQTTAGRPCAGKEPGAGAALRMDMEKEKQKKRGKCGAYLPSALNIQPL